MQFTDSAAQDAGTERVLDCQRSHVEFQSLPEVAANFWSEVAIARTDVLRCAFLFSQIKTDARTRASVVDG